MKAGKRINLKFVSQEKKLYLCEMMNVNKTYYDNYLTVYKHTPYAGYLKMCIVLVCQLYIINSIKWEKMQKKIHKFLNKCSIL